VATNRALVMDVDGVVAPVHGKTAWGDDVVAGRLFGPVLVSPTLCARLDELAAAPDVTGFWLTDWLPEARARMDPFPGRDWASIARPPPSPTGRTWTKWPAIQAWLDEHPEITTLVWCDDHLNRTRRATIRPRSTVRRQKPIHWLSRITAWVSVFSLGIGTWTPATFMIERLSV